MDEKKVEETITLTSLDLPVVLIPGLNDGPDGAQERLVSLGKEKPNKAAGPLLPGGD